MKITKTARAAAVGALALALAGGSIATAQAAVQPNGSDARVYYFDDRTDYTLITSPDHVVKWDDLNGISPSPDSELAMFDCPTETTEVYTFVTKPGTERKGKNHWDGWAPIGFHPEYLPDAKRVMFAPVSTARQINGSPLAAKATGGVFSQGFACTIYDGNKVVAAYYQTINIATDQSGDYTVVFDDVPAEPASGDIALAPSVVASSTVDGALSLSVPANASATFSTPTLNGNNQSVATGTLPAFTVTDERRVSSPGWKLTADVKDFVLSDNPSATPIVKAQLGLRPTVTGTSGAVAGAEQLAGSAVYAANFATAAAGSGLGVTTLGGDLSFVAPKSAVAGLYKSTMTVTVVSN